MGYNIDLYDAIVVEPPLPDEFTLAANRRMRGPADVTGTDLARWPALDRLTDEVPFDLTQYEVASGRLRSLIEPQADNDRPYEFEDHLDLLRGVIVETFPSARFSGAIRWRGEESVDTGVIAIEASGAGTVLLRDIDVTGISLPDLESAWAALHAAGVNDTCTAWLDSLLALRPAEAGIDAPASTDTPVGGS